MSLCLTFCKCLLYAHYKLCSASLDNVFSIHFARFHVFIGEKVLFAYTYMHSTFIQMSMVPNICLFYSDGLVGRRIAPIVLTALLITCEGLLKLQFASQFPFLPLMLTSIMCAVFLVYAWYLSLLEITFPSDKPNQNISGKLQ